MNKLLLFLLLILLGCQNQPDRSFDGYTPAPLGDVTITSDFWLARIDSNRINGIRSCFSSCNHSLINFDVAAGISDAQREGTIASDSDVYKIIEGAAYALQHTSDLELEQFVDSLINRIGDAQEDDGYLYTHWSINDLSQRWTQVETKHELYCAGHLFEAAVAYFEVTGKRRLLDIAIRFADHIDSVFGTGKLENVSGHQEIEIALVRLYEATGEKRYLELAAFFLEERGNPERLAYRASLGEDDPNFGTPERFLKPAYRQDHLPVKDQRKATGHAVRAAYLYSGMADFARVNGSTDYLEALTSIWEDITYKKIYITGAIGTAQFHDEGFGSDYNLPNASAYCETCSAIALMLWNHRMAQLTGDFRYADLFEITLYNGGISGGSASGDRFFYTNPLEGRPRNNRHPWYEPGCCPSNYVRFIPQIDQFIYGQTDDEIYVNQFIGSVMETDIGNQQIVLHQKTNYPWDESVEITIKTKKPARFSLMIRIPGWIRGEFLPGGLYKYSRESGIVNREQSTEVLINGEAISSQSDRIGYLVLNRKWKDGDEILIKFDMPVSLVEGRPEIRDVEGQQVLTRGPVVYCLESIDNPEIFENANEFKFISETTMIEPSNDPVYCINLIQGEMLSTQDTTIPFTAIPYFTWRNRGPSHMKVWW